MKALLAWWKGLCKLSKFMRFVDVNLRGIGQGTMMTILTPSGIPTLTATFVLVTWPFPPPRLISK